jgi:hypothetical protein
MDLRPGEASKVSLPPSTKLNNGPLRSGQSVTAPSALNQALHNGMRRLRLEFEQRILLIHEKIATT